jgi:Fe2+ transport system protein FeoA
MQFPLGARTFALISVIGSALGAAAIARAQGLDVQQKAVIEMITDTADRICGGVSETSDASIKQIKGDVKAQLTGLASKLVDVGFTEGGNITNDETEGVLQTDLATALRDNEACKLSVLETLASKLLRSEPPPPSANGVPPTGVSAPVAPKGPTRPPEYGAQKSDANALVVPKSTASMSCDELWHERNAIYARNGYCFKTQKAVATFGKGCFAPYGELQGSDKNHVTEISISERQKGC